jgi:hypothetical protein
MPLCVSNTHNLKAKFALYEICRVRVLEYISNIDPRITSILEGIHDNYALSFKALIDMVLDLEP